VVNYGFKGVSVLSNFAVDEFSTQEFIKSLLPEPNFDKIASLHAINIRLELVLAKSVETLVDYFFKLRTAVEGGPESLARVSSEPKCVSAGITIVSVE